MGRPKLPSGQERGEVLTLRLTASEREAIERAAGHLTVSEWARRVLLASSASVPDG